MSNGHLPEERSPREQCEQRLDLVAEELDALADDVRDIGETRVSEALHSLAWDAYELLRSFEQRRAA